MTMAMTMRIVVLNLVRLFFQLQFIATTIHGQAVIYGPSDDASWAIQSPRPSNLLTGDKQELYERYIRLCNLAAQEKMKKKGLPLDPSFCTYNDKYRIQSNREQPPSVYNYTQLGYQKIRTPPHLFQLIQTFYHTNKHLAAIEWPDINTYQNMWEYPSTIVRLEDAALDGGGPFLSNQVSMEAQKILEEWVGQNLQPVSLYGVREYHRGSILAPHIDRVPLVTSAIINVDQVGMDEPWVLEVYGHDGKATNITMEVGDMVLYESHSVIHGRPFPLRGDLYANVFVHFEPTDTTNYDPKIGLPPYIIPGTPLAKEFKMDNPHGWLPNEQQQGGDQDSDTEDGEEYGKEALVRVAIEAVWQGDVDWLREIAKDNPEALHELDNNGWHALHEAVRFGNMDMVKILLEHGTDINQETVYRQTPLNLAIRYLGHDHPITAFLLEQGAVDATPDLQPNAVLS